MMSLTTWREGFCRHRSLVLSAVFLVLLTSLSPYAAAQTAAQAPKGYVENDDIIYVVGHPEDTIGGKSVYLRTPAGLAFDQSFSVGIDGEERLFSTDYLSDAESFRIALEEERDLLAKLGLTMSEADELVLAAQYFSADDLASLQWMLDNIDVAAFEVALAGDITLPTMLEDSGFPITTSRIDPCAAALGWFALGGLLVGGCCGGTAGVGCLACGVTFAALGQSAFEACFPPGPGTPTPPVLCLVVCHDCGIGCNCECIQATGVDPNGFPICPPPPDPSTCPPIPEP